MTPELSASGPRATVLSEQRGACVWLASNWRLELRKSLGGSSNTKVMLSNGSTKLSR